MSGMKITFTENGQQQTVIVDPTVFTVTWKGGVGPVGPTGPASTVLGPTGPTGPSGADSIVQIGRAHV